MFISLSLCSLHHHNTPTPLWLHLLSLNSKPRQPLPNITARDRDTLLIITSFNETDLSFSSKKTQNRLSFTLFPTTGVRSFLAASNTWHCKKVFFSLFEFIFWIFLFTYMVCFVFINWHAHSYVERKLVLFDKILQWGWMH